MPLPAAANTRAAGKHEFRNPYARGTRHPVPLKAELVWHMAADGSVRLAWVTDVEVSDTSWYETVLDAQTGAVLERKSRYRSAVQGRVFTEQHPDAAPSGRTLVDFSGVNGSWVDEVDGATTTTGNNTITYRDFGDDNTLGYQPLATDEDTLLDFSFGNLWAGLTAIDPNDFGNVPQADWEAALNGDLDAAVTQLFYYVNQTHDWLYAYGFDEASGNFQDVNFSGLGIGGDRVVTETHNGFDFGCDGGTRCINNANFGTDGDGTAARMQMYLSIPPNQPYADRSFNGDTIVHEYGHGVSNRLVPGTLSGATNQAGSLGEGWSDALAFLRWDDPVYGDYTSFDKVNGIRNFSYDTNPWTYGDYSTGVGSPHRNGEIWAATLYGVIVGTTRSGGNPNKPEKRGVRGQECRNPYAASFAMSGGAGPCCLCRDRPRLPRVTAPSPLLSAAPRRPATTWCVKNEPFTEAASWALSIPELDDRSAVPSVATFMRSTASSGGPTVRPFACVQLPPRHVSRIATRTRAVDFAMRSRRSASASSSP